MKEKGPLGIRLLTSEKGNVQFLVLERCEKGFWDRCGDECGVALVT